MAMPVPLPKVERGVPCRHAPLPQVDDGVVPKRRDLAQGLERASRRSGAWPLAGEQQVVEDEAKLVRLVPVASQAIQNLRALSAHGVDANPVVQGRQPSSGTWTPARTPPC